MSTIARVVPKRYSPRSGAELMELNAAIHVGKAPRGVVALRPIDYVIDDTLFLGQLNSGETDYNQTIGYTIETEDRPNPFTDDPASSTARIVSTFMDKPIIAVQCGRECVIRNLKVSGPVAANYFSNPASAWYQSSNADNFETKLTAENLYTPAGVAAGQWNPFTAIAIDPYGSQVSSGNRYPGQSARYVSNAASSAITIQDVAVMNAQVGILGGVGVSVNTSENKIYGVKVAGCKYAISLCHAQAKNWRCRDFSFNSVWGVATGNKHGLLNGPLPVFDGLDGSFANYLLEWPNGAGGPCKINGGLMEVILRLSPGPLGGGIGVAGAASGAGTEISDVTINWGGGDSNTTPQIHAGCCPLAITNSILMTGAGTKKLILSSNSTAYTDGNLLGLGAVFERTNIRGPVANDDVSVSDAIALVSGHSPSWFNFRDSWVYGSAVGPSNTRMKPLVVRGGGL